MPRLHIRVPQIDLGFVPLIDAAPLIVADYLGYFADEGLDVRLQRQIGWGNVRDKLTYGQLEASHALVSYSPASVAGMAAFPEPLVSLMSLGTGGNAITFATRLGHLNDGERTPALWRRMLGRPLKLAHVAIASAHHYLLRDYLATGGLDPDRDAVLSVIPPPQMAGHLRTEVLDGFCSGEPWNTLAMMERRGTIVAATTQLRANHPEKVLAVTRRWYDANRVPAESLVRATLPACDFCEAKSNRGQLTEILARPEYLSIDEAVIEKSLSIDEWFQPNVKRAAFRSFARKATEPCVADVEWIVRKMVHWSQLPHGIDPHRIATASIATDTYAQAVASLASRSTNNPLNFSLPEHPTNEHETFPTRRPDPRARGAASDVQWPGPRTRVILG
jgi:nitrate/nitrite transport system substrate-binding protein